MRGLVDVFGRATLWDLSAYRCLSQPEGRIPQVLCNCNARSAHFSRFPHPFAHKDANLAKPELYKAPPHVHHSFKFRS
jgi:hypothetical protein